MKGMIAAGVLALGVVLASDGKASAQYVVQHGNHFHNVSPGYGHGYAPVYNAPIYRPVYTVPVYRPVYGGFNNGFYGGGFNNFYGGGFNNNFYGGGFNNGFNNGFYGGRSSFGLSFNFVR
jgi:hypothetical protein